MKPKSVKCRKAQAHSGSTFQNIKSAMLQDPISPEIRPAKTVCENKSNNDDYDPRISGVLDQFLNANGPSSVTIETIHPSPDKRTSEMVRNELK